MTSFLVNNFAIFYNFVFPLPFDIDFSKMPFEELKNKNDIVGILRLKEKKEDAILKSPYFNSRQPTYCDSMIITKPVIGCSLQIIYYKREIVDFSSKI